MYITKEDCLVDLDHQSVELSNSDGVRHSVLMTPGDTSGYAFEDAKTLIEAIQRGCRVSNNGPCLGWRDSHPEYKWLSYDTVIQRSKHISYGLLHVGMKRGQQSFVGVYAQNCVEWVLVEYACYSQCAVVVPLYDTLGPTASQFILNHVEAEFLICDTEEKAKNILNVKEDIPKLNHIVVIQEISDETKNLAAKNNVILHQLKEIEELGRGKSDNLMLPSASDLATVCFTSGTTGDPKGVMLTHGNVVAGASAFAKNIGIDFLGVGDKTISYLPMGHIFDRICQVLHYSNGGAVGFFRGDIKLLLEDISVVAPTFLPVVPRILNKVFDRVQNDVKSSMLMKMLLETALHAKESELQRGIIRDNSVWDRYVLKKIRNIFGGKVRLMVAGGAPVRNDVLDFFRCSMGCVVVQVYGQTEVSGGMNCTVIGDYTLGNVGPPLPSCYVKLQDVPEMGYHSGSGEILIKGPTVMKGYYKDPMRTAEVLDEDGWLHTGDIGKWIKGGALCIIDRKKSLMKLSQGEYVSPEKVEAVYQASPYVEQIFVHGESTENFLVAIIVPERETIMSWCSQQGILGEWKEICKNKVVKERVLEDLRNFGNEAGLKGFEQVKAIHLYPETFSQENGILTATMKVKRAECKRQFREVIHKMYNNLC